MATMSMIKVESIKKEIEKYQKSLATHEARLAKKVAICDKLHCNWDENEFFSNRDANAISNEQWSAWDEMDSEKDYVKDYKERIENAEKRLAKRMGILNEENEKQAETDRINKIETQVWNYAHKSAEELEAEYQKWLAWFKAECLRDGIVIDKADSSIITGKSKTGKQFLMYINDGFSTRSFHCYTLRIEGQTIYTSGTFATGYSYLMSR